jgi:hypothetical protein
MQNAFRFNRRSAERADAGYVFMVSCSSFRQAAGTVLCLRKRVTLSAERGQAGHPGQKAGGRSSRVFLAQVDFVMEYKLYIMCCLRDKYGVK